jgi:hypothetical protein
MYIIVDVLVPDDYKRRGGVYIGHAGSYETKEEANKKAYEMYFGLLFESLYESGKKDKIKASLEDLRSEVSEPIITALIAEDTTDEDGHPPPYQKGFFEAISDIYHNLHCEVLKPDYTAQAGTYYEVLEI